jgi:hypothetical protein
LQHRQALLPHQLRLQFPTQQEIGGSQLPIQLWRGGSLLEPLLQDLNDVLVMPLLPILKEKSRRQQMGG